MADCTPTPMWEMMCAITDALNSQGLEPMRATMTPGHAMAPELNDRYAIDLQSTASRTPHRNRDAIVADHVLTVTVHVRIPAHGSADQSRAQLAVYDAAFTAEKKVRDAIMVRTEAYSAEWLGTARTINAGREVMSIAVRHRLTAYHPVAR